MTCPIAESTDREHHRGLDEDTHYRRQRGTGLRPEQHNCRGHRQFKEVARSDQRPGRGHRIGHSHIQHDDIGERCVQIDLQK